MAPVGPAAPDAPVTIGYAGLKPTLRTLCTGRGILCPLVKSQHTVSLGAVNALLQKPSSGSRLRGSGVANGTSKTTSTVASASGMIGLAVEVESAGTSRRVAKVVVGDVHIGPPGAIRYIGCKRWRSAEVC